MKKNLKLSFLLLFIAAINASDPLFLKYSESAINLSSLVERNGVKYKINSQKPFSGKFIGFEDEFGFCVVEAGTFKNGHFHGAYESYEGCGEAYSEKINYKNGLQHGDYILYEEGYLAMEGQFYNDLLVGEWKGYEYGLLMWTEAYKNDELLSYVLFEYHDNGQIALKESYDGMDKLDGISEAYHSNGQLKSKIQYKDGNIVKVLEKYDFNGYSLPLE